MIQFGPEVCSNLDRALTREWLETNGLGGFASSTIVGLNTRRYHGLLVAATRPPLGRRVLLSKLEETLIVGGHRFDLSTNRYPDVVHPEGYRFLTAFKLDPFPVFTYLAEGVELEKTVFMVHGENTTIIQYELKGGAQPSPARKGSERSLHLELRPLLAFRDYHALTHENPALDPTVDIDLTSFVVRPYRGLPALHISHGGAQVAPTGYWYRRFEYEAERARGLDFVEDLFNPCVLTIDLSRRPVAIVAASTQPVERVRLQDARRAEEERRRAVVASSGASDEFTRTLVDAADRFLVSRGDGTTVIAGYHWFSDWGRDTMIALPGLTLATGRPDAARGILAEFLRHADRGMIPNRFPDAGEAPEYTAADAALWVFHAVHMFLMQTDDDVFVHAKLYEGLRDIIDWHVRGTRHGIRVHDDGLLIVGPTSVPVTWMDVKIAGQALTPRHGKPVEIEALWYNALRVMEELAKRCHDEPRRVQYATLAGCARRSFNRQFWNPTAGCLYDVIESTAPDDSIRPNQVLAVGLPFTMVSRAKAISILNVIERDLLTPYGLRTLAPTDPQYRGRYEGDTRSRDAAYHHGTAWPWLLGPFVTGYVRVYGMAGARATVARWLEPFRDHLLEAGVGQISEVFDGDPPHRPAGCIAQAWSVAEVLRVALMSQQPKPRYGKTPSSR
jgi:predicted glycogen debranching enzyme